MEFHSPVDWCALYFAINSIFSPRTESSARYCNIDVGAIIHTSNFLHTLLHRKLMRYIAASAQCTCGISSVQYLDRSIKEVRLNTAGVATHILIVYLVQKELIKFVTHVYTDACRIFFTRPRWSCVTLFGLYLYSVCVCVFVCIS